MRYQPRFDRRKVAVGNPLGPRRLPDVVRDRAQGQIDDAARVGRDVGGRGVHQIAVEHQHRAGFADRRYDAALIDEPGHRVVVEGPQRIGCCRLVVARRQHTVLVASRHQHQRAVDVHDLVHEHRDVHGPRFRHAVIARPGAVILVPLPDVPLEGRLGVDLVLVHVEPFAEHLLDRPDQPRVMAEEPKGLVVGVRGKGGARCAGLLAPHLLTVGGVNRLGLVAQGGHLLLGEAIGEEQIAFFSELPELLLAQRHCVTLPLARTTGSVGGRFRHRRARCGPGPPARRRQGLR